MNLQFSNETYYEIRKRKDPAYEGKFFIGVWSRGVFCRVTCPDALPDDKNDMVYFSNIYEGFENGLRPCPDCEPDMHADQIVLNLPLSALVRDAVEKINDGYLNTHTVVELAELLFVSERYLRKLFTEEIGISPSKIATYHRGVFAKKMIYDTDMPITEIAYMSGFGSVRQFNEVFKQMFHASPSDFRRENKKKRTEDNVIYIVYPDDFCWSGMLDRLKRQIVHGVELVSDNSYCRTFSINGIRGYFILTDIPEEKRLKLEIFTDDRRCYQAVYHRLQRMFDINADIPYITSILQQEKCAAEYLPESIVPRLLLWFSPMECLYFAVLRQQMTDRDAKNMLDELIEMQGSYYPCPVEGLNTIFHEGSELDIAALQYSRIPQETFSLIRKLNQALKENRLTLAYNQTYKEFSEQFRNFPEITYDTIHFVALHGLGMKDTLLKGGEEIKNRELRAYVALLQEGPDSAEV